MTHPLCDLAWRTWDQGDTRRARELMEEHLAAFRHLRTKRMNCAVQPNIVVQLAYVGATGDNLLLVQPDINSQMRLLVEESSSETGLPLAFATDTHEFETDLIARRNPYWLLFKWAGPYLSPDTDTLETVDQDKLQSFGQMLVLTLTRIVREARF